MTVAEGKADGAGVTEAAPMGVTEVVSIGVLGGAAARVGACVVRVGRTRDVAEVLTRATVRMAKYLRRRGLLEEADDEALDGLAALAASATSG
ncbi:MAG TPA: hypothetical protein VF316_23190, partial [Polyangiaceae bacterium]